MVPREQLDHKKRADLTSIRIWRKIDTDLSIQDIHKFNHLRGGIGPHNSQWHKLENNKLEPYNQVFKSLAGFFDELANEKKFAYVPDQKLRERLQKAKPYLTHDGRVPTMIDLIEIFEGYQPVYFRYSSLIPAEITEDVARNVSNYDRTVFVGFATDEMLNKKEAWESLNIELSNDIDEKTRRKLQMVCAGQDDWSIKDIKQFTNNGKKSDCFVNKAFASWTGKTMPSLEDIFLKGSKMKWPNLVC
tara:strand:- start:125 stop:862 length:738 start_codon:yes stop_codon:yes gene_type:complete